MEGPVTINKNKFPLTDNEEYIVKSKFDFDLMLEK